MSGAAAAARAGAGKAPQAARLRDDRPSLGARDAGPFEARGFHRKLYRFSLDDYKEVAAIWHGQALDGAGDAFTPEYHPEEIFEMAQKLYQRAK